MRSKSIGIYPNLKNTFLNKDFDRNFRKSSPWLQRAFLNKDLKSNLQESCPWLQNASPLRRRTSQGDEKGQRRPNEKPTAKQHTAAPHAVQPGSKHMHDDTWRRMLPLHLPLLSGVSLALVASLVSLVLSSVTGTDLESRGLPSSVTGSTHRAAANTYMAIPGGASC